MTQVLKLSRFYGCIPWTDRVTNVEVLDRMQKECEIVDIYTVRVEMLNEFCETAEVEYQKILGYSKTRWLALLPAVERILKLYDPLKSYFLSQDKCPRILEVF